MTKKEIHNTDLTIWQEWRSQLAMQLISRKEQVLWQCIALLEWQRPSQQILKKIAKEKGQPLPVDLDDKNTVEAYIKANNDKYIGAWNQQLKRQKFDHVYTQSLWSGQTPITFNFNNWDSSRQISKQHAEQLKQKAQQLARRMLMPDDEPFNVMLEGSPGTGKTSLAVAMIDYIRYHGYRWGYLKHPDGFADKYKRYADVFFLATDEMLELVYHSMDSDSKARD